ncbi:MAG: DUF3592 domain-containing protein [Desulfuromonadales bacterium]|nr:DUF3592 domain-containing protein [Desulfuromonadales bacterium]
MRKLGIFLLVTGWVLVVVVILAFAPGVPMPYAVSNLITNHVSLIIYLCVVLIFGGAILCDKYPYSPAVENGPLVRGTVIKVGGSWRSNTALSRYTVQYTTLNGEQIISKIDASKFAAQKGMDVPVRYNPKKPKQFMLDTESSPILFKEDLTEQGQANVQSMTINQGQVQMNFDPMQLQAQMMNEGVTTQAAMDIRNTGVQAKGVVLSAQPTGNIVGNNGEIELKIEVTRPDGSQYEATVRKAIPAVALPYVQAGRVIQVFYKPEDEQNITIGL